MNKIKNKFSFVMPMVINHRTEDDNDLERILKVQLPTFRKFLKLDDLHKFYIVSRKKDLQYIKSELNKNYSDFPFEYVDEKELIPELNTFPLHTKTVHPGWIIQQLVKFELAKVIETEYYMTFETDLFLTRKFSYESIFNDGKIICSSFNNFNDTEWGRTPSCEPWYMYGTALVYGNGIETFDINPKNKNELDGDKLKINKLMGVSPQILITEEVNNLIKHLEKLHKISYINLLLNTTNGHPNTWTEYTLYWMWLHKEGKMDKYSFEFPYLSWNELFTFNYRQGFGDKYFNEFDTLVMNNDEHYFSIVQSNILDVKLDFIVKKLKKHIGENK